MCSGNCDGAAATIVVNDEKLKSLPLEVQKGSENISFGADFRPIRRWMPDTARCEYID